MSEPGNAGESNVFRAFDLISPLTEITHLLKITGLMPGLAPNPLEVGAEGRAVAKNSSTVPL